MTQSSLATRDDLSDETDAEEGLIAPYAPDEDRPLAPYAGLMAVYGTAVAAAGAFVRRRGYPLPRLSAGDVALVGVATYKISRTLSKNSVTSPIRAPFTRFKGRSGPAELAEEVRGEGVRKAVGELLTCPFCLSQWTATALVFGLVTAPRATRLAASMFTSLTLAEFLQFAHAYAEQQTE